MLKKEKKQELITNEKFFVVPKDHIEKSKKITSIYGFLLRDYFNYYFSTPTGKRLNSKIIRSSHLGKELNIPESSVRRALIELEKLELFVMINLKNKGKICMPFTNENQLIKEKFLVGEIELELETTIDFEGI